MKCFRAGCSPVENVFFFETWSLELWFLLWSFAFNQRSVLMQVASHVDEVQSLLGFVNLYSNSNRLKFELCEV